MSFFFTITRVLLTALILLAGVMPGWGQPTISTLDDVQDYLDTVDQAGLYALLNQPNLFSDPLGTTEKADLTALYHTPEAFRGQCFPLNAILDHHLYPLSLGRHGANCKPIYYAAGKVPFTEKKQFLPAIFIFKEKPGEEFAGQQSLKGCFYMVLRVPTQKRLGEPGQAELDYLVFLAALEEGGAVSEPLPGGIPLTFWGPTGLTLVLLLGWFMVKYRLNGVKMRHWGGVSARLGRVSKRKSRKGLKSSDAGSSQADTDS